MCSLFVFVLVIFVSHGVLFCFGFFVSSFLSIVNIIIFYRVMIKWMGGDIGRIRGELGAGEEYDHNIIYEKWKTLVS